MQTIKDLKEFLLESHSIMHRQSMLYFTILSSSMPVTDMIRPKMLANADAYAVQSCADLWVTNFLELLHDADALNDDHVATISNRVLAQNDDLALQKNKYKKIKQERSYLTPNFEYDSFPDVMNRHFTLAPHLHKAIHYKGNSVLSHSTHIHFNTVKQTIQYAYHHMDEGDLKGVETYSAWMTLADLQMEPDAVNECAGKYIMEYFKHNDATPYIDNFNFDADDMHVKEQLNALKDKTCKAYQNTSPDFKQDSLRIAIKFMRNHYHLN